MSAGGQDLVDGKTRSQHTQQKQQEQQELKFLRWFYQEADFGPAHSDVIMIMMQNYHAADPENIIPPDYVEELIYE